MRFFIRATMPVDVGNELVSDPEFGQKMKKIIEDLKPEEVYYSVEFGQRTIYFVVNVKSSHEIPSKAEPLWQALAADVDFIPVMNQKEFAKAAPSLARAVKKHGFDMG